MNELIKELADRLWRVHPADIDALGLKSRTEFYEQELKKFAELIVRECGRVYIQNQQDGVMTLTQDLLQHFGVEE